MQGYSRVTEERHTKVENILSLLQKKDTEPLMKEDIIPPNNNSDQAKRNANKESRRGKTTQSGRKEEREL